MNKKCTLLVAALMTAGVTAVYAAGPANVPASDWTAGNYYYLKSGNNYLSLSGSNPDSVVVKAYVSEPATKAAADSALWQITQAGSTPLGVIYQFTNKATNAVLSFAASEDATTNLAPGINAWGFADAASGSPIYAYYGAGNSKQLALALLQSSGGATPDSLGFVADKTAGTSFEVIAPNAAMALDAQSLGNGFSVFQLMFGSNYGGNIFAGKQIIAKDLADDWMTLQIQGDETFANGTPKYFGVDTTKTSISGATGVFGANFKVDSTYAQGPWHSVGNAKFQHFKFTVDLKNDSLAMYVEDAPTVDAAALAELGENVRVVYASVGATQVLTVANLEADGTTPAQGAAPQITAKPGTPSAIATGTGVYFLKSASKTAEGGKYWVSTDADVPMLSADSVSVYHAMGQWYVKEMNGKYSIGSRYDGSMLATNTEVFAVAGMANTFMVAGDSVTFEYQKDVDLANKFLGVRHFTAQEIANNGYQLSAVAGLGVGNLPVYAADSLLRAKAGMTEAPIAFRVALKQDSIMNVDKNTGAVQLGDQLYTATYKLAQQFMNDSVAYNSEAGNTGLVLSATQSPLVFTFVTALEGGKYQMVIGPADAAQYVSLDVNNANLILSDKVAYFDIDAVDAPEYATFQTAYKEISTNGKFLAMNPLNFYAEVKNAGQPILKADYNADNFQMWVEKVDTILPDKNLYYISTALTNPSDKSVNPDRFYLASMSDSTSWDFTYNGEQYSRAGFISHDTIKSMKNSPALFAFKSIAGGEYLLENQRDLNAGKPQYVGVINNVVVMTSDGVGFDVEAASGPTSNEELSASEVVVLGGTGSIVVKNASGKTVTLSNILGKTIGSVVITSDSFTVPAERGIVVVAIEGESAQKVLVK